MKINPIGIEAYRQTMEKSKTDVRPQIEKNAETSKSSAVHLPGQANKIGSKLANKLESGTFADMLTTEEKQAFEMVFEKFRQIASADGSYRHDGETNLQSVGNFVDVTL
ncbi:MAG: hypothetical protein ABIJ45_12645 [Candidatus Zixiibacteriota bacterium]